MRDKIESVKPQHNRRKHYRAKFTYNTVGRAEKLDAAFSAYLVGWVGRAQRSATALWLARVN